MLSAKPIRHYLVMELSKKAMLLRSVRLVDKNIKQKGRSWSILRDYIQHTLPDYGALRL